MKKSKKVEKPLGSTRKQIEDTLQNLERFRVHFSVVSDKFAKALQASSGLLSIVRSSPSFICLPSLFTASAQQLRYVADDIAREATELSKHEPQLALGSFIFFVFTPSSTNHLHINRSMVKKTRKTIQTS